MEQPSYSKSFEMHHYLLGIGCGITGSLAALCMKEALVSPEDNVMYGYLQYWAVSSIYEWYCIYCIRAIFFILSLFFNTKMIEFKIKSLAAVGASFTVIVAFFTNYIFSIILEIILWQNWPQKWQYIGSSIIVLGIFFLQRDETTNSKRANQTKEAAKQLIEDNKTTVCENNDKAEKSTEVDQSTDCEVSCNQSTISEVSQDESKISELATV